MRAARDSPLGFEVAKIGTARAFALLLAHSAIYFRCKEKVCRQTSSAAICGRRQCVRMIVGRSREVLPDAELSSAD